MKQNSKTRMMVLVFVGLGLAVSYSDLEKSTKWGLVLGLILLFLLLRRSFFYYAEGQRRLQKDDSSCWKWFKKAVDAGIGVEQQLFIASAFIKQGDSEYGINLCKEIAEQYKGQKEGNTAILTLSIAYWEKNELDMGIEMLEQLKTDGCEDPTLYLNLTTYLLEAGRTERAEELIAEFSKKNTKAGTGMTDNKLWLQILRGEWDDALKTANELMDLSPKFPEAYLHYAQVMLHFGRVDRTIEYLRRALSVNAVSKNTTTREFLETFADGLSDPETRNAYAVAITDNTATFAAGKVIPVDLETTKQYVEVEESQVVKVGKKIKHLDKIDDDDNRLPNTDLTEEDEVWEEPTL